MQPIDMILHCPNCGRQHIDAAAPGNYEKNVLPWSNPPHRSHLCHGCGFTWRPADVPTNGVESIATKGNNGDPFYMSRANALAIDAGRFDWHGSNVTTRRIKSLRGIGAKIVSNLVVHVVSNDA